MASACRTSPTNVQPGHELIVQLFVCGGCGAIHLNYEKQVSSCRRVQHSTTRGTAWTSNLPKPVVCQMTPTRFVRRLDGRHGFFRRQPLAKN